MALAEFDFTKLGDLDGGRVLEAINQALERAVFDCDDRPGVNKARTVTLKIGLTPVVSDRGDMESVHMSFSVGESRPVRASRSYAMDVRKIGRRFALLFNELSPEDTSQMTLDMQPGSEKSFQ